MEIEEIPEGQPEPTEVIAEALEIEEPEAVDHAQLASVIESLLFASDKPLTILRIQELIDATADDVSQALGEIEEAHRDRGVILGEVAGGYQFRTNPKNAEWVQKLIGGRPVRLTRAQLETLAIVAYRQPITRPEVDDIRGVDTGSTIKTLLDRSLIRILGKKEEPGRPMLYGTTKEFLGFFNLKNLKELPTLREFHELTEEHQAKVDELEEAGELPAASPVDGDSGESSPPVAQA